MSIMELSKTFSFDAAHNLTELPEGHKCRQLHGHTFEVIITVKGKVDKSKGWVMDYSDINQAVLPVLDMLDHSNLNTIQGLENPTSEKIALFLWNKLKEKLPMLYAVNVKESPSSSCVYKGES